MGCFHNVEAPIWNDIYCRSFYQHQDVLDLATTRKLIVQDSDFTNTQQCYLLSTKPQFEADLYDQGILGRVTMVFDLIEYRRELVIGQAGNESTVCAPGMKGTPEIDTISDIL